MFHLLLKLMKINFKIKKKEGLFFFMLNKKLFRKNVKYYENIHFLNFYDYNYLKAQNIMIIDINISEFLFYFL